MRALDDVPELAALLDEPRDRLAREGRRARATSSAAADELVRNFVRLLVEKGRAGEIRAIAGEFEALVAAAGASSTSSSRPPTSSPTTSSSASSADIEKASGREVQAIAQRRPEPDRRHRPPGRLDAPRRERARPPRPTSPSRLATDKELAERVKLRPEEITSILRQRIEEFDVETNLAEVGAVLQLGDGIARVHGLENCVALEMLELDHGVVGLAFNLEEDNVGVALFGDWEQDQGGRPGAPHRRGRVGPGRRGAARPRRRPARQPARRPGADRRDRAPPARVEGAGRRSSASR